MADLTDGQLLDQFAVHKDAAAFEQLVRRHMDWTYSCARRQVRDAHLAEDVTQAVFILLADKARQLRGRAQLNGWLFRATRYCAANAAKTQQRREHHEMQASLMRASASEDAPDWEEVYPLLDEMVRSLGSADRDAVLLRFYQGKSIADVGAAMGISVDAAGKRVQRAVARLRGMMERKGVTVSATGLATVMATQATQAAPAALMPAVVAAGMGAAKTGTAALIAGAAGKFLWWTPAKFAAAVLIGGVAVGVTCQVVRHAVAMAQSSANSSSASSTFGALYEKAPGSSGGLSKTIGPNTFRVTAVVRYGADGRPVATDGQGKPLDVAMLPMASVQPPGPGNADVAVIFLQPSPDRFDINRLRVFDHLTRQHLSGLRITPAPGISALRIAATTDRLPPQIDLWLDVASYDAANVPANLAAKKDATVRIGDAIVGFTDIRYGRWNIDHGQFSTVNHDRPETTLQLRASGPWTSGRYQISAISKSKQKYLSDFFVDLSSGTGQFLSIPFALDNIDHFELRPLAKEPPFYFDGVALPAVAALPVPATRIPKPVIIRAGTQSSVRLPSGAVVQLLGISYDGPNQQTWWDRDGLPTHVANVKSGASVAWRADRRTRNFALRLTPAKISGLLVQFDPACSWASSGDDNEYRLAASLDEKLPITVRLGAAVTDWTTLEELPVDHLPAASQNWPGEIESMEATDDGVAISTSIGDLPDNVRLVLIDQVGKVHQYNGMSSYPDHEQIAPWGQPSIRLTYRGLKLKDVRAMRLETRQAEYAVFENVAMDPK